MSSGQGTGGAAPSQDGARPLRPLYGEYATSEEQRRRIEAGGGVADVIAPPAQPAQAGQDGPASRETEAAAPEGRRRLLPALTRGRRIERFFGFALVLWGLLTVIRAIPQMTNYPVFAHDLLTTLGVDATLSDLSGARFWGVVSALIFGLGWLATALLTWQAARRGMVLFWIPLLGAIVFGIVAGITMSIPLVNDPAVLDAITSQVIPAP